MSGILKRHQRKIIWAVVIAFFVGGVGLVSLQQSGILNRRPQAVDGVAYAAKVNDQEISFEVVQNAWTNLFNQYSAYYQQIGQDPNQLLVGADGALFSLRLRTEAYDGAIRQALYDQAARERRIEPARRDVDAAYATEYSNLLQQNNITETQLNEYLVSQGRTLVDFQASFRAQIETTLRNEALRETVVGAIVPTDDDLMTYFEANISRYDSPEEIRASHILVTTEDLAWEVHTELVEGADFAELAAEYSQDASNKDNGGDLGWFGRGTMVTAFEDAAFALEVGELSEPAQTEFGYHIIRLDDRREAHTPTLDEVKDQVRDDYIADESSERFATWYDEFRTSSDIEITDDLVNAYLVARDDTALGIVEYERLQEEDDVSDPYLAYYIGNSYEDLMMETAQERRDLEEIEEPTDEQAARLAELEALSDEYEAKALAQYLRALDEIDEPDESLVNRILLFDSENPDAHYALGTIYRDQGNTPQAESEFNLVIGTTPDYVDAYIASGDLAVETGASAKAVFRYEAALELRPNDPSLLAKLVSAYVATGAFDQAAEALDLLGEIDPGNVKMVIARGDIAHAQLEDAVDELQTLQAKAEPTADDEARIAELETQIEELDRVAVDSFEEGLKVASSLDLNIKLGQVHLMRGRLDEAEDEFLRVKMQSPYRVEAYVGLAEVQIARGEIDSAVDNLHAAFSRSFDDLEKEEIAKRILEFTPEDVDLRLRLARVFGNQYKWSAATREYAAVLEARPDSIEAYLGIGEAYRWRNDPDTAIEYLQRGLEHATYDSDRIDLYLEIVEAARSAVGGGQPLEPVGLDARIGLAKLYLGLGADDKALEQLELVQNDNDQYRRIEVRDLIVQAGGTVEADVVPDATPDASIEGDSELVDPSADPATDADAADAVVDDASDPEATTDEADATE